MQQKEKKTVDNRKLALNQEEVINTKVSQGLKI